MLQNSRRAIDCKEYEARVRLNATTSRIWTLQRRWVRPLWMRTDVEPFSQRPAATGRFAPVAPDVLHRPVAPKKQSVR